MNSDTLRKIHEIFEYGLVHIDTDFTDEQVEEICTTFDELYWSAMHKCNK